MGAGLPTQRVGSRFRVLWGGREHLGGVGGDLSFELLELRYRHCSKVSLHHRHSRADFLFELSSFGLCHRSEEGLYPFHLGFGGLLCGSAWAFSSVMAGLSASVTCAFSMYFVSSAWCVSCSRGTRSTGCRLSLRLICTGACMQPRKKGGRPVSHVVG